MKPTTKLLLFGLLGISVFGLIFLNLTDKKSNLQDDNTTGGQTIDIDKQKDSLPKEIFDINQTGSDNKTDNLTILMPGRFFNDGFIQLAKLLQTQYQLNINYKKIDNISYYKDIISGKEKVKGIDLYLIPSDRLQDYKGKKTALPENIGPFFNPIFSEHINLTQTIFVPYSIDPLVTIFSSQQELTNNKLNIKHISSYLASHINQPKINLLRGIDKNDQKILEQGLESFPNYFIITYNLLHQLYLSQDNNNFDIIQSTLDNPGFSKRNFADFKIKYTKLNKQNPQCGLFPDICLLSYGQSDIKFGFLSDILIAQKYFNFTGEFGVYNFPYFTGDYKIRGRGFVPDSSTNNLEAIQIFTKQYLKAGSSNTLALRNNTISAFNTIIDIQKTQNKYSSFLQYLPDYGLIVYPFDLQSDFIGSNSFKLFKQKNSYQEFFNQSIFLQ